MKLRVGVITLAAVTVATAACGASSATGVLTAAVVRDHALLPGESVVIKGAITPEHRTVSLQRRVSGSWENVRSAHTSTRGRYAFTVHATTSAHVFRVHASAVRALPTRNSAQVTVKAVTPKGSLSVLNVPIGQTAYGTGGRLPAKAKFSPVRKGASVAIQRKTSTGWSTIASGRQNGSGVYLGALPAPSATTTYRAITWPGNGASRIVSPSTTPTLVPLSWSDNFGGTSINPAHWSERFVNGNGRTCAVPSPTGVKVANGVATFSVRRAYKPGTKTFATRTGCKYGVYDNMALQAVPSFKYGTFAARIKFQSGGGQHGAFTLQGAGTSAAEMDTVEFFGTTKSGAPRSDFGVSRGVYSAPGRPESHVGGITTQARTIMNGKTPYNSFHTYAVSWSPSGYRFYIDGQLTLSTSKPYAASVAENPVLVLVTSNYELPNLPRYTSGPDKGQVVASKSKMQVDWVKVWQ